MAFSINLIFTYPLTAYPANIIIESYIFKEKLKSSKSRTLLRNVSRSAVSLIGLAICILIGKSVDKFISLSGTLTCTPIGLMLPAIFHYKLTNPTKNGKRLDIFIIVVSIAIQIFCTAFTLYTWND